MIDQYYQAHEGIVWDITGYTNKNADQTGSIDWFLEHTTIVKPKISKGRAYTLYGGS